MEQNALKRKILYIASHRGTKEADIIICLFTQYTLNHIQDEQLKDLEDFLQMSDLNLLDWYFGRKVPEKYEITPMIKSFLNWKHDKK